MRDADDCAPPNPTAWRRLGAVVDLLLDGTRLSWSAPGPAGAAAPVYDVLRTEDPSSSASAAWFGESGTGRTGIDEDVPTALIAPVVRVPSCP